MIALLFKIIFLSVADSLGVWAAGTLAWQRNWGLLSALLVGLTLLNLALLSRRAYPLRYLLPGLVLFAAMTFYPIVYTINIAFTNYGTGHLMSKEEAISWYERRYYQPEEGETFSFQAFKDEQGQLKLLLTSQKTGRAYLAEGARLLPISLPDPRPSNWRSLSRSELVQALAALQQLELLYGEEDVVRMATLTEFAVFRPQYHYDRAHDLLTDLETGKIYRPIRGTFVSEEGEELLPGFYEYIGLENFYRIFSNPQITGPFLRVFQWTFLWATLSVLLTFALGLTLAIFLNDPYLKARRLYRSLLIIPYAIPGFISILVWAGLLNADFGIVNRILEDLLGLRLPWLNDPFWGKVALLLVNLWLGYPYMMIVSLGALQSIQPELYEAAYVDGASRWQQFRHVTFPILMISVAPLLIGSFAFNFNNFNVIYLLTGGGPPIAGAQTPAGATDILISYTYKLAFAGRQGAEYGFAAAITILIFLIVGTISAINFRLSRRLEKMGEAL